MHAMRDAPLIARPPGALAAHDLAGAFARYDQFAFRFLTTGKCGSAQDT